MNFSLPLQYSRCVPLFFFFFVHGTILCRANLFFLFLILFSTVYFIFWVVYFCCCMNVWEKEKQVRIYIPLHVIDSRDFLLFKKLQALFFRNQKNFHYFCSFNFCIDLFLTLFLEDFLLQKLLILF